MDENYENFFSSVQKFDDKIFKIFSYRLASYGDWLINDHAIESRGTTFRIDDGAPQLVSLPFPKFFNLNENPFTMDLDLSQIKTIWDKLDGSLISTFFDKNGTFSYKSKASLHSDVAVGARELLQSSEYIKLHRRLFAACHDLDITVNMEYCGPQNMIVIGYEKPFIKVLGARYHSDGSFLSHDDLVNIFDEEFVVDVVEPNDKAKFIESVYGMTDNIEGFVFEMPDGQRVKIKTDHYCDKHKLRTECNALALFDRCLDGQADDLKATFHNDQMMLGMIDKMNDYVIELSSNMHKRIDEFYHENKDIDKKYFVFRARDKGIEGIDFTYLMQYEKRGGDYDVIEFLKGLNKKTRRSIAEDCGFEIKNSFTENVDDSE